MSYTIYAYFNTEQVATLMDAVASLTASADYWGLFKVLVVLSFIVFVAGLALGKQQEPMEFFRWIIILVCVHSLLLIPKADVVIVDRTGQSSPQVRDNVPLGLAFFASLTSHMGDYLTRAFETVFALPTDLQFQRNGLMFGNTLLDATLKATPASIEFQNDFNNFVANCTYYDVMAGRVSGDLLTRSKDVWDVMANTGNAIVTPYANEGAIPCSDAYSKLDARFPSVIADVMKIYGKTYNPDSANNNVASALLGNQIESAYTNLSNISSRATQILRQNMSLNMLRQSQTKSAQGLGGASEQIVNRAVTEAEQTSNTQYLAAARVAERAAPVLRNIVEIIAYAIFPIIVLILVVSGEHAGKVLKSYVMTLVWVQLIPPLYAILNYVMTSASQRNLVGVATADDSSAQAGVSLVNLASLGNTALSDVAIAGYLSLSIPVIAWAIVKGGEVGGAALFSGAIGSITGSSGTAAADAARGNVNQGNVSTNNTSSNTTKTNSYDVAPTITSGFTRVTNGQGTATYGPGSSFIYQTNQSSLGFNASFGSKIAQSLTNQARQSESVASEMSAQARQLQTSAVSDRIGVMQRWLTYSGSGTDSERQTFSRSEHAFAQMASTANEINQSLGLAAGHEMGRRLSAEMYLAGSGGVKWDKVVSIGAETGIKSSTLNEAGTRKNLEASLERGRQTLSTSTYTANDAVGDQFSQSRAYDHGRRHDQESIKGIEANLTKANEYQQQASVNYNRSQELSAQASQVTENWTTMSMNAEAFVAKRLQENGLLGAYTWAYQNKPEYAAQLASEQLAPYLNSPPTPVPPQAMSVEELAQQAPSLPSGVLAERYNNEKSDLPNSVSQANVENRQRVLSSGFTTVAPRDTVSGIVKTEFDETGSKIRDGKRTTGQEFTEAGNKADHDLNPGNQLPGMKPKEDAAPGSAPATIRDAYNDLK